MLHGNIVKEKATVLDYYCFTIKLQSSREQTELLSLAEKLAPTPAPTQSQFQAETPAPAPVA